MEPARPEFFCSTAKSKPITAAIDEGLLRTCELKAYPGEVRQTVAAGKSLHSDKMEVCVAAADPADFRAAERCLGLLHGMQTNL